MPRKIIIGPKATITVNNVYSQLVGLSDRNIIKVIDNNLSYYVQNYQFSRAFQKGWWDRKQRKWKRWDGKKHLLDNKLRFHTGLLNRVLNILKNHNVNFTIDDQRKEVKFKNKINIKNIQSRPYQDRVHKACLRHKGGIIKSATGSGKSIMIARLVADTNVKTMVYVIGTDLLYQMKETFEDVLNIKIGIIGDGHADIRKINICSVWTAASALGESYKSFDDEDVVRKEKLNSEDKEKITKAIRNTEMVIFDECQFLATQTLQLVNNASVSAYYKFGFSATPTRDDNADLLLEAVCGRQIVEITATELVKDGWLVTPKIHFINVPEYKGDLPDKYQSIYKTYIVENEVRNEKIIKSTKKLLERGRRVLILVKNIKHGEILLSHFDDDIVTYFVRGDIDSEERNRIRQEFIDGEIDVIIASVVYDQGVNLPNLDALILAGSGKSSNRALQRIGRTIRLFEGKKDAIVIDFIDNAKYLLNHSYKRLAVYKSEPGFKIKLPNKGFSNGRKK